MNVKIHTLATLALVAGTVVSLGGCSNNKSVGSGDNYSGTAPHAHPGASDNARLREARLGNDRVPPATATPKPNPVPAENPAPRAAVASTGSVMYIPTGERNSSALMIEKIYPTQVTVGQPFDYIIKATNISSLALSNVTVTEAAPTNFTISSVTPTGNNGVYNLGTLNPGESKSVTFKGSAGGIGSINSCASATYSTALCSTINVVQPALAISKEITPESILNCSPINMTIKVKNTGSGTATNVRVADTLPAGLTLDNGGTSMDESIGDIAPGAERVITKSLKATGIGSFNNTASVKADGVSAVQSNTVTTIVKQPKLEITCKAAGKTMIGRKACYELTIRNTGNAVAAGATVALSLPSGVTTDCGASITFGDIAPGASVTKTCCITGSNIGSIALAATASANCAAPASTNCTIEFIGLPDIGTLLTDGDGVVTVGANHIYTYEVQNQGQVDLTNVRVEITLPEGVDYVSTTAPKAPSINGRKLIFTGITGILKPGEKPTFTMTVKSRSAGEKLIISETFCDQLKTPVRDDELTNFVEQ